MKRTLVLVSLMTAAPGALAQPPSESSLRLVRSACGTGGSQRDGRFEVLDPRTAFVVPQDKQVLVYFEWDGEAGPHHFEGRWKDPSGAVVLVAPADHQAQGRRFSMYWMLALNETVAPGLWALETTVDGAPGGTHTFEIRGGRRVLTAAQLYESALGTAATVERVGPAGEVSELGVATALNADALVVPFGVIDGASLLRIVLADGRRLETSEIGASSRRAGWATLRAPGHGLVALPRAPRPGVGEAVFVLDTRNEGGRTIGQTTVVGEGRPQAGGGTLLLADGVATGSPVLNAAGEQVGVVVPDGGVELGETGTLVARVARYPRSAALLGMEALPSAPTATVRTLAQLAAQGHFMRALSAERRHVVSGVFAARVERGGPVALPVDQRTSFARSEAQAFVFVQWNPQDKLNAKASYEIYDAENKLVARSAPVTLKLKRNESQFSTLKVPIANLPAGHYRVDLLLESGPVWRGWLRVTD